MPRRRGSAKKATAANWAAAAAIERVEDLVVAEDRG